jgi:molybdopterin synthase catalytic subunit
MGDDLTEDNRVRLTAIRAEPLSVDEVLAAVTHPEAGGTAVFVGTVRKHDGGREVRGLGYTSHATAETELASVTERIAREHGALAAAAVHRVGDLEVGDLAVVVAIAAPHRGDAIVACRALIDELKATVPIWKHQTFTDGSDEWVGSP